MTTRTGPDIDQVEQYLSGYPDSPRRQTEMALIAEVRRLRAGLRQVGDTVRQAAQTPTPEAPLEDEVFPLLDQLLAHQAALRAPDGETNRAQQLADALEELRSTAVAGKRVVDASSAVTHVVTDETLHYTVPVAAMRALRRCLVELDAAVRHAAR